MKFIKKKKDKLIEYIVQKFSSKDPEIKLDDPQKRLEDNLTELARVFNFYFYFYYLFNLNNILI